MSVGELAACGCPRLTVEDERYGYAEGCEHNLRWCEGCRRWCPQVGWWWGGAYFGSLKRWVCSDCRYGPLTGEAAVKYPDVARSHPAARELVADHPTFVATAPAWPDDAARFAAAEALSRAAGQYDAGEAGVVLARLAELVRSGPGDLVVDVAGADLVDRGQVLRGIRWAASSHRTPGPVATVLDTLANRWETWLDRQEPAPDPPRPSPHVQRQRMLAGMLAAITRPVVPVVEVEVDADGPGAVGGEARVGDAAAAA